MELLTVIVIVALLASMIFPVLSEIKARMEKAQCMSNLRNLYVGANLYVQDQQHWPQIATSQLKSNPEEYAKQWIKALTPYGISETNWHCPTVQRQVNEAPPDPKTGKKPEKQIRIDYFATPFDERESTPRKWSKQPWFIERGAVHGNGNLIIFTDGTTTEMNELLKRGT
jgi:type II secretory pathway pseudopilin PulG